MIPVRKQAEPSTFTENVTKKANAFLSKMPDPTPEEIRKNHYWRNALGDLHRAYNQVCAYSALWCPRGMATVDHFIPVIAAVKRGEPGLAYDWNNFRLASRSMNEEKKNYQDVLDPFLVKEGWFVMEFPSLMIKCNAALSSPEREKVETTIRRLKLNEKEKYIDFRRGFLWDYCEFCKGPVMIEPALRYLEKKAPFMAFELKRLGLTLKIVDMMKFPKKVVGYNE